MYNADTELLFPPRIIPSLRDLRGATWKKLVDRVEKSGDNSDEKAGFVLMMVRINGCVSCNADSFRAMHGCTQCTKQAIQRLKESDKQLSKALEESILEVKTHLASNTNLIPPQVINDPKPISRKRRRSGSSQ